MQDLLVIGFLSIHFALAATGDVRLGPDRCGGTVAAAREGADFIGRLKPDTTEPGDCCD
jgi:hypothetical protein